MIGLWTSECLGIGVRTLTEPQTCWLPCVGYRELTHLSRQVRWSGLWGVWRRRRRWWRRWRTSASALRRWTGPSSSTSTPAAHAQPSPSSTSSSPTPCNPPSPTRRKVPSWLAVLFRCCGRPPRTATQHCAVQSHQRGTYIAREVDQQISSRHPCIACV